MFAGMIFISTGCVDHGRDLEGTTWKVVEADDTQGDLHVSPDTDNDSDNMKFSNGRIYNKWGEVHMSDGYPYILKDNNVYENGEDNPSLVLSNGYLICQDCPGVLTVTYKKVIKPL